ncbi:DUF2815 family protein [Candidatus Dojkabacteria bacterium]|uniref:DUF2815 family protein n=1 Tax=Candidatus Dojkabacteria bacterium TaxID=2099670 RepID=A0A5C7J7V7_9BACT|nr:MAG: DUF2815 family protein [Candidatus Dojkabacteria bacterium]
MSVLTPKFRVSYPSVFKPRKNDLNGKEEFTLTCLFKKGEDLSALKNEVQKVIEKKWGADEALWPKGLKLPFRDQGEKAKIDPVTRRKILPMGHEEGAIFINLKSTSRPGIVDQNRNDIIAESDFYAGCFGRASVSCYAYDQKGNRGVAFGLINLQKLAEGEPLSGRPSPQDDFTAVEVEGADKSADGLFN